MSKEAPLMLIVGSDGNQAERLLEAGACAGFVCERVSEVAKVPPRSELDPDLVVVTSSHEISESMPLFPAAMRERLVWVVEEKGWPYIQEHKGLCAVASDATVGELSVRLPEALERIRQRVWSRLGLPVAGNNEALWELIPATDWVTGLDNRLRFLQELQKNLSRARRYKRPFCCLLVRLDNHQILQQGADGEERINATLEEAAGVLEVSIRDADFLARMHNDLFGLLLPETDFESGHIVVSRIRNNLLQYQFSHTQPEVPRFSCGISAFDHNRSSVDTLLADAQRSLDGGVSS